MFKNLISSFRKARHFRGSNAEKISVFFFLIQFYIKRHLFKSKTSEATACFLNYKVAGSDYATLNFLFNEIFITNEYYLKPSEKELFIIDCGANIGMSVLYFKRLFPNSRILAFEPNPYAFELLSKNIKANNVSKVELYNVALYDKESEISFFIKNNKGALDGSVNKERGGSKELKVIAQKLSQYIINIPEIDLIKIDVEGAEINIIEDLCASGTLQNVKEYLIEFHHNLPCSSTSLAAFLEIFEQHHFKYNIKTGYTKKGVFQDILIHFYKA